MPDEPTNPADQRELTDESLRQERENSDQVIAEQMDKVDVDAEEVLELARERASAVLDAARQEADRRQRLGTPDETRRAAIRDERAIADETLHSERDAADEALRRERQEHLRLLAALLPFEREKTDRNLLTERARADAAVEHRDDFMGMVTHDLRNLLGAILVDAEILTLQASGNAEGQRTVAGMKRLQRHVARMNSLVGDLLDVVSIDAGRLTVLPSPCDIPALLAEAVEAFAAVAADKRVALEVAATPGGLVAAVDHDRMFQVLGNLIGNALKFTPRGGTICLQAAREGEAVRLSVADTGIGIAPEMLEAIFERFWQVGNDDRRGAGLGLYICRCLVTAHGGRIWAESVEGQGTAIHITLPVEAAPPTAAPAAV
jgi:signal transduction histidine kinase